MWFWLGVKGRDKYYIPKIPNSIQIKETRDGKTESRILNTYALGYFSISLLLFLTGSLQLQMKTINSSKCNSFPETPGGKKRQTIHVTSQPQRLEYWGALRAFLRPTFFLSTTLESLVRSPSCLKGTLWSSLTFSKARAMPREIAWAWPDRPPPSALTKTS